MAAVALTVLIAMAGGLLQAQLAINRDVAFYMYIGSRMLGGHAPVFADIDHVLGGVLLSNILLYLPPSAMVATLDIPFEWPLRVYVLLLATWSFRHVWRFCTRLESEHSRIWVLPPILAAMTLLFPVESFGQREHLFALLILPYLLATILETEGLETGRRPLAVGLGTLVAVVIKPHFVILFLAVEAVRMLRLRRWRALFDPVNLIVGAGHGAYYATVAAGFVRGGFDPDLVAWVLDLKRAYLNKSLADLLIRKYSLLWLPAIAAIIIGLRLARRRAGSMVWAMAFAGGLAAAIFQSLGVDYHWLIATVLAAMAIGWVVAIAPHRGSRWVAIVSLAVFTVLAVLRSVTIFPLERATTSQVATLARAILAAAPPSPTVLMINGDYGPLYPVLGRSGFTSASSYHAYWFLDAMASRPALHRDARPEWIDGIKATTARDIIERRPGLILIGLIDRPQYDMVTRDDRVRAALADYHPAGNAVGYLLLRRKDHSSLPR